MIYSNDSIFDTSDVFNVAFYHVSFFEELRWFLKTTDARWCTGQDDISWSKSAEFRTPSHDFIRFEYKLFGVGILFHLSIDNAFQVEVVRILEFVFGHNARTQGAKSIHSFSEQPLTPVFT